ncbi:hypothetical protein Sango_2683400 [Sesamum angolense]|uniref:Uncharacterized protein n=1 Tax=Sesamum angolense TaxID=2727404 RepID=A0AAE2BHF9_9LAMI|nr:hypothetical protein Sango_2683400 [Sesamum angolense]
MTSSSDSLDVGTSNSKSAFDVEEVDASPLSCLVSFRSLRAVFLISGSNSSSPVREDRGIKNQVTRIKVENYPRLSRRRNRGRKRGVDDPYLLLAVAPPRYSPIAPAILAEALQTGAKISNLFEYDGIGDPQEHLDKLYAKIDWYDLSDTAYCKVFRTTLSKRALTWFNQCQEERHKGRERIEKEERKNLPPVGFTNYSPLNASKGETRGSNSTSIVVSTVTADTPQKKCHHLKNEIEKLIQRKHLREYINQHPIGGGYVQGPSRPPQDSTPAQPSREENLPMADIIVMISRGPAGGDSTNARKALAHAARGNKRYDNAQLRSVNTPFTGFSGEMIGSLGDVTLPLSLGSYPKRSTKMQDFSNPELSGKMVKWAMELSEFHIKFHPRPTIKAQMLADFIVELAHDEMSISMSTWSLYVDGSSTVISSGGWNSFGKTPRR